LKSLGKKSPFLPSAIDLSIYKHQIALLLLSVIKLQQQHLFLKVLLLVTVAIKDTVSCNKFAIEVHLVVAAAGRSCNGLQMLTRNIPG